VYENLPSSSVTITAFIGVPLIVIVIFAPLIGTFESILVNVPDMVT